MPPGTRLPTGGRTEVRAESNREKTFVNRRVRHRARTRTLASVLLLAFLGVLQAEAFAVRDCPHHRLDGDGATASPAGASGHVTAEGGAIAHLDAGDAHRGHGSEHGPCSCLGSCHAGSTVPMVSLPADWSLAAAETEHVAVTRRALRASRFLPYFLPYPNAPPRA